MILSTVNFVNNYKFSDFIIDKITEEQSARDEEVRRKNKRHSLCAPSNNKETDFACRKRSSLKARYSGEFSKTKLSEQPAASPFDTPKVDTSRLITIETTDQYTLTADSSSLHISLRKHVKVCENNVFKRIDFDEEVAGQGRLTVFQLHSNPSYFLATTHLRHLELQSYCADTLDESNPDERFFRCFRSEFGVELVQPHAHKGYYIHHIDNFINLRKLELNFRPPEEFFLHMERVDVETIERINANTTASSSTTSQNTETSTLNSKQYLTHPPTKVAIPDISKSSLKRKDSKKIKDKSRETPLATKSRMLSCFGVGLKKKKDKTKQ